MRGFIVFLMVVLVAAGVSAQDLTPTSTCDDAQVSTFLAELTELITGRDKADDLFAYLDELQGKIATQRWMCSDMILSGKREPGKESVVLGPVSIPDGIYRLTITTKGDFYTKFTKLAGSCGYSAFINEGDATNGSEEVFTAEDDCSVLVEVEADAAWQMKFVPIAVNR